MCLVVFSVVGFSHSTFLLVARTAALLSLVVLSLGALVGLHLGFGNLGVVFSVVGVVVNVFTVLRLWCRCEFWG